MIKKILLVGCLLANTGYAEEISTFDKLKASVNKLKESGPFPTETKIAEYRDKTYSTSIDIFCNTEVYTQGHKMVEGVGCSIEYKFFAKKVYESEEITGHLLPVSSEDDCDKAIAICKSAQFGFKEVNENTVDILQGDKIVGTVDFSKAVVGFLAR